MFADFASLLRHLESRGLFRMQLGLDRMKETLSRLKLQKLPFKIIQVIGTNGKGSTCAFLSSLAHAHGLRAGLHCSPHFVSVRERILIQNKQVPTAEWLDAANTLMQAGGEELTYFEFITCLAVFLFTKQKVDLAIMETGLGGSFDATTALTADLLAYTPIDIDHTGVLGENIASIAIDKAGAIRPGQYVLSCPQQRIVTEILTHQCKKCGEELGICHPSQDTSCKKTLPLKPSDSGAINAIICWPKNSCDHAKNPSTSESNVSQTTPSLGLMGAFQTTNAALALASFRLIQMLGKTNNSKHLDAEALLPILQNPQEEFCETQGLAAAWLPGRMQQTPAIPRHNLPATALPHGLPPMILDGAHNAHALRNLGLTLAQHKLAPLATIFSCMEDKDIPELLTHLRTFSTGAIFVPPIKDNPRAANPKILAEQIGLNAYACASLEDAVQLATSHMFARMPELFTNPEICRHPLLVCGSLYLLGELYAEYPVLLTQAPSQK